MLDKQILEDARHLRAKGDSYRAIGQFFGVGASTIHRWLMPQNKEQQREYNRRWKKDHYTNDPSYRIKQCLQSSRRNAIKRGHQPCTITVSDVLSLFSENDNTCECCGVGTDKLVIDHDHETGKFRGLLCGPCNISLGHYEKIKCLAERYLSQ